MTEFIDKMYCLIETYIKEHAVEHGLNLLFALIIFFVGKWAAKFITKIVKRMMKKADVDQTVTVFVGHLLYTALLVFVIITAVGKLGIPTASFVAVLGAAGLAIGLALQGSLSNFAAGFLLIIFKPFKVGDVIEGAGVIGLVEEIQMFTTQVKTGDNKKIIIPNSKLSGDNIINYTARENRRVDLVVGVGYGDDLDKVKSVIANVLDNNELVLKEPAYTIGCVELADSSVNFVVRPWVKTEDYWNAYFGLTETIKKRFDAEGICIPFPQRDVHIYEHKE